MRLGKALLGETRSDNSLSMDQWVNYFKYQGINGMFGAPNLTLGEKQEEPESSFEGYVQGIYKTNGVVFACMLARLLLFSEARFQFRRRVLGRPGELFGTKALRPLEEPWPGGTTGNLLTRAIQDADLAGNFFAARRPGQRIKRLRPDWVTIILGSESDPDVGYGDVDAEVLGYIYKPGGYASTKDAVPFVRSEVAHFAPIPDPLATYRGMSWLTPVLREIMGDQAATSHKLKFFEQGATPNLVVTLDASIQREAFEKWLELFEAKFEGSASAYKTMYLGAGAKVEAVGSDLKNVDFKAVQGAGEPLALDTPVPTPKGWTTMGEINPGDEVFGRNGTPIKVLDASPVHTGRPCYKLTFSDRTSIIADEGHRWRVIDRTAAGKKDGDGARRRPEITLTTAELVAGIAEWNREGNRYGVPAGLPVELPTTDLLIDPYALGVWLGDGQTAGAAVCGIEPDLGFIAAELESRGYTVTKWKTAPDKADVIGLPGGLLAALEALGVLGNKHIPDQYLRASKPQRLDLLRGLMDTDGTVGRVGRETCEFSSKLEALARQVAELSRSLGYRSTVSCKLDSRSRTGQTWRVTFRADPDVIPFLLERKAERCQTPVWVKNRAIISIEPVESVPVRCIAVDADDHLFRAGDGWTLTHNTRIAAAAGVPPIVVGLSEGLSSATYSNYGQARRRFADGTMRPLWREISGAMETLVPAPEGTELWYDDRDIPFLQEDRKDEAEIQQKSATTIRELINAGFEPDSAVAAVNSNDMTRLKHTGLVSVQLQQPGVEAPPALPAGD